LGLAPQVGIHGTKLLECINVKNVSILSNIFIVRKSTGTEQKNFNNIAIFDEGLQVRVLLFPLLHKPSE